MVNQMYTNFDKKQFASHLKRELAARIDLFIEEYAGKGEVMSNKEWMEAYVEWSKQKQYIKELATKYLLEDFNDV